MLEGWQMHLKLLLFGVLAGQLATSQTSDNLLRNGDFVIPAESAASSWTRNEGAAGLGASSVVVLGQRSMLRLSPTARNPVSAAWGPVFGYSQGLPAVALPARVLYLSAYMGAEGESTATVRITGLWADGRQTVQELRQGSGGQAALRRDLIRLPFGVPLLAVVVTCSVEGGAGAAYIGGVRLSATGYENWLEAMGRPDPGAALAAEARISAYQRTRTIPTTLFGANLEWPWNGMGLWDPARDAPNPAVLNWAQRAGLSVQRFPGGVFADYYDWRKGVGPIAARGESPPMPGIPSTRHFLGTDEALRFARLSNSELMITVNIVTDTPTAAAEWVRYVNAAGTRVRFWEIGNESYSRWEVTPEQYAARYLQFAAAMRAVDANIKLGAIADEQYAHSIRPVHPGWTDRVLALAGNEIDFLAVHLGYAPLIFEDRGWNARTVYAAQLAAPELIAAQLKQLTDRIQRLVPGRASRISIAVTEWGPLFQIDPTQRFAEHAKTMASALYTASTLKAFIESPRTEVANFFKLVDFTTQGLLGYRNGGTSPVPSLSAIQLFRRHFGPELVRTRVTSPVYDSPAVGWVDAAAKVPYLDVVASTSTDRKTLYILAINKHFDRGMQTRIFLEDAVPGGVAEVRTLSAPSPDATTGTEFLAATGIARMPQALVEPNSHFYGSGPEDVAIRTNSLDVVGGDFTYTFPPHSITVIKMPIP